MATLVFNALGTLVGGPIGGAIGSLLGRQVDAAILGGGNRQGPRLKELTPTTSSYGMALPRHFGRMRVAGSIIWATDLVEHVASEGGGKSRPAVTTYSYTASFAVALASRPIVGIGRIWADGNLLRGADGVLKTSGTMRIYVGHGDQDPDPLIALAEGADRCPAWRGLAYVVFEDLELGDFFNRIPALTFEVIADEGAVSLQPIVAAAIDDVDADVPLDGIAGFTSEGPIAEALQLLDPMFPMSADAGGLRLTIARERLQDGALALPEPAVSAADGDFGGGAGFARRRLPRSEQPPEVLRYYDLARDYLPGLQRAPGRTRPGQPQTIELPAALTAADARALVERTARHAEWTRERIAWRSAELDTAIAPGTLVTLPGQAGLWRVCDWEWRAGGVELTLQRLPPDASAAPLPPPADAGRINPPADLAAPPTVLAAFELPWDGSGSGDAPALFAAASSPGSNWHGAALFADQGDGGLLPLRPSGRTRSVTGIAEDALAAANPLLFDRAASVTVALADASAELAEASGRRLSAGANRALIGGEIVQFGRAVPLGDGRWRLECLLRGRGGTEAAVAGHVAGERFVLLDARPVAIDAAVVGSTQGAAIVAAGLGDEEPVVSDIALRGITPRPLSPVHPRAAWLADGSLELRWTRRARGAWLWPDGVDAPLNEQSEAYQVTYGPPAAPLAAWEPDEPALLLSPATLGLLATLLPAGEIHVRQRGSHALSEPLLLAALS